MNVELRKNFIGAIMFLIKRFIFYLQQIKLYSVLTSLRIRNTKRNSRKFSSNKKNYLKKYKYFWIILFSLLGGYVIFYFIKIVLFIYSSYKIFQNGKKFVHGMLKESKQR